MLWCFSEGRNCSGTPRLRHSSPPFTTRRLDAHSSLARKQGRVHQLTSSTPMGLAMRAVDESLISTTPRSLSPRGSSRGASPCAASPRGRGGPPNPASSPWEQKASSGDRAATVGFMGHSSSSAGNHCFPPFECGPSEWARAHGTRGKLKGFGTAAGCHKQSWAAGGATGRARAARRLVLKTSSLRSREYESAHALGGSNPTQRQVSHFCTESEATVAIPLAPTEAPTIQRPPRPKTSRHTTFDQSLPEEAMVYDRRLMLRYYSLYVRKKVSRSGTRPRLPHLVPYALEESDRAVRAALGRNATRSRSASKQHSPTWRAAPRSQSPRRRAVSTRQLGPTWQVPLLADLSKGGNSDGDDWKGLKGKAVEECDEVDDSPGIPVCGEVGTQYNKSDSDDGFSKGEPLLIIRNGAQNGDFQADQLGSNCMAASRHVARTDGHRSGQRTSTWAVAEHRDQAVREPLKARRRARTVCPSETGCTDRTDRSYRECSLKRGSLRGFRRSMNVLDSLGPSRLLEEPPQMGRAPNRQSHMAAAERGCCQGGRDAAYECSPEPDHRSDRGEGRHTSRIRGRSEDSAVYAKALGEPTEFMKPSVRAYRPPWTRTGEGLADDGFETRRKPYHSAFESWRSAARRSTSADSAHSQEGRPLKLKREVRALLNKISPENEASILAQLANLEVSSTEDLRMLANLTIEKALCDPFYSEVYAKAIGKLSVAYRMIPLRRRGGHDGGGTKGHGHGGLDGDCSPGVTGFSSFTETILEQCSGTFEKFFGRTHLLDDDDTESEEEMARRRQRAQAYMRLLGHLHMGHGIISTSSLLKTLNRLLLINQDTSHKREWPPKAWIECACELLYTVGRELSRSPQGKMILKAATESLSRWKDFRQKDVSGENVPACVFPPRIQFMVQDIIEASLRGWPSHPHDEKGVPEKAKCKMPVRLPNQFV